MTAAVIFLWAGCLWAIARSVLSLALAISPWRRLLALASLALAAFYAHKPKKNPSCPERSCVKNNK